MNARRILYSLVALAGVLLIVCTIQAVHLRQVLDDTNELTHSYMALDRWLSLVAQPVRDLRALAMQGQAVIEHLPATLAESRQASSPLAGFLNDPEVSEHSIQAAYALQEVLVEDLFYCHQMQRHYSFLLSLMQFLLVMVTLAIAVTSYFMGHRAQDYRLAPFPEANPNPVFGLNLHGDIIYFNKAVERAIANHPDGKPQTLLPHDYRQRLDTLKVTGRLQDEWIHSLRNRTFQYRVQIIPGMERVHVYSEDITEKESIRARNAFIAYHDPVCLLANRQRLELIIDELHDPNLLLTLAISNLQGLSKVLSTQGLDIADHFAREYSIRLRNAYQSVSGEAERQPIVFRMDTNLFGCLYFQTLTDQMHEALGLALNETVAQPFFHGKREFFLQSAAESSRLQYQRYDERIEKAVQAEHKLEQALRYAVRLNELVMLYQPQQDLKTGRLSGFEALMRWYHDGVMEAPLSFIPLAEKTGLIHSMGNWALRQVLKQRLDWQQLAALKTAIVAVNISAHEFARRDFIRDVETALRDCGDYAECIQIEITESVLIQDECVAIDKMHRLKELGFSLAIDDFGTGYSSFSYLSRLPVDQLKIDQSFIANMANGPRDEAMVSAMIQVAHELGIKVVAEGVETEQQRQALIALGCDMIQGYWYGKPMSVTDATLFSSG
ncbi:MAG: bifunctional diguanylate cyclase/phosphodiesterase [Reinekea sp.]